MKKILFMGYVLSPEEANYFSGASIAGNKMQWNIVKNLASINDVKVSCVTITPLATYPHDKNIFQSFHKKEILPGVISYQISYVNVPIIKQIWQIFSVYKIAKKIIKKQKIDLIFCFNLFPQIGIPMRILKKIFGNLDVVCLLADLPLDDNTERRGASRWLRQKFENSTLKSMKHCDKYIVLNEQVIKKYLPGVSFIVIDGGVDEDDIKKYDEPNKKSLEHNILYSGALTEYNGILNLLQALEYLKNTDIFLDIYGNGYLEEVVRKAANCNSHIRYYGRVDNEIVIKKQKEAWILINPRVVRDPIAEVTFPSKTFEYMLSGTPILSTRLNGYSDEYDGKMLFLDEGTAEEIAKKILEIRNMDEEKLQQIAINAKNFIIRERKWSVQAIKIKEFCGIE